MTRLIHILGFSPVVFLRKTAYLVVFLGLCCSFAGLGASPSHLFERGEVRYLLGTFVNIRKKPALNAGVIAVLPLGTAVKIQGKAESLVVLKGIYTNWYKVSFQQGGMQKSGYVWGGLIAVGSFKSKTRPDTLFLYGLNRISYRGEAFHKAQIQLRVVRNNQQIARMHFNSVGEAGYSAKTLGPMGLKNLQDIIQFDFSSNQCGGDFGKAVIFWNGTELVMGKRFRDWYDAPVFRTQDFIFPTHKGGIPDKIILKDEAGKSGDDGKVIYRLRKRTVYIWTGKQLKRVGPKKP